jgi:hypothetical protein
VWVSFVIAGIQAGKQFVVPWQVADHMINKRRRRLEASAGIDRRPDALIEAHHSPGRPVQQHVIECAKIVVSFFWWGNVHLRHATQGRPFSPSGKRFVFARNAQWPARTADSALHLRGPCAGITPKSPTEFSVKRDKAEAAEGPAFVQ